MSKQEHLTQLQDGGAMRKATKIRLIAAALLVLVLGMIFCGVMTAFKWDFSKLSTVKYETNVHDVSEEFSSISVETDTAALTFVLSDDRKCHVKCYEESKWTHSVTVQEETLVIKLINEKSWYDYIGINFGSPKITVHLPKEVYAALSVRESTGNITMPQDFKFERVDIALSTGDVDFSASASEYLKIKTSTGEVSVQNATAGALELSASTGGITVSDIVCHGDAAIAVSTGKVKLQNVQCKNLMTSGDTGDIRMENVCAAEKFSIERTTGDVKIAACDAAELSVKTDTGNVTGSLLTEKVFITQTDTGRINVPKTTSGGICEIITDTGDIQITIK